MRQNKTKQLLEYWLELFSDCNSNPGGTTPFNWPDRSAIQPAQCRSLLGNMFILETIGSVTRYRLAGTKLCGLYGRELKREKFSHVFEPRDQRAAENWVSRLALDEHAILICTNAETDAEELINLETLLLPLSNAGSVGRRVLGISVPHGMNRQGIQGPIISQAIRSARVLRPWESWPADTEREAEARVFPSAEIKEQAEIEPAAFFTSPASLVPAGEAMPEPGAFKKFKHLVVIDGGRNSD